MRFRAIIVWGRLAATHHTTLADEEHAISGRSFLEDQIAMRKVDCVAGVLEYIYNRLVLCVGSTAHPND